MQMQVIHMKKNKKIIIAIIVCFTFIITLMGATILNIKDKMDNNAIDLTQNLLDNMANSIANYCDEGEAIVEKSSSKFKNLDKESIQYELNTLVEQHGYLNAIYYKNGKGIDAQGKEITKAQLPYQNFETKEKGFSPAINGSYGMWETVLQMPCDDDAMLYIEIPFSHFAQGNDLTFYNKYGFAAMIDSNTKKIVLTSKTPNVIWHYMQNADELLTEIGFDANNLQEIYDSIDRQESLIVKGKVQGESIYLSLRSVQASDANSNWYLCGIIPVNIIQQESSLVLTMLTFTFALMILTLVMVVSLILYNIYHDMKKEKKRFEKSQLENAIYNAMAEASDQFICLYDKTEQHLEKFFHNYTDILGLDSQTLMNDPKLFYDILETFDPTLPKRIENKEINDTCIFEAERINPISHEKRFLRLIIKNINVVGKEKYIFFIADISQDVKIQESLKMAALDAKQANQAKSDFLSKMSHEIRTPMNAIMGMSELAMHHLDRPDKLKDYLKKISQSSTHLLSLINDILDLSKIESGKMALYEEKFTLSDCISDVYNIITMQANAKH